MVTVSSHLPMLSLGLLAHLTLITPIPQCWISIMPTLHFPLFKSAEVCKSPSFSSSDHPKFATTSNYLGYCTIPLPLSAPSLTCLHSMASILHSCPWPWHTATSFFLPTSVPHLSTDRGLCTSSGLPTENKKPKTQ